MRMKKGPPEAAPEAGCRGRVEAWVFVSHAAKGGPKMPGPRVCCGAPGTSTCSIGDGLLIAARCGHQTLGTPSRSCSESISVGQANSYQGLSKAPAIGGSIDAHAEPDREATRPDIAIHCISGTCNGSASEYYNTLAR